jgi:hypothetical protein
LCAGHKALLSKIKNRQQLATATFISGYIVVNARSIMDTLEKILDVTSET